jgi:hypothetical protein
MSAEVVGSTETEVFVYAGAGSPRDVVRVRVDPSVTLIPNDAFLYHEKLAEVELCEGLVEIGEGSFSRCDNSITKINIPATLRRICNYAFRTSLRCPIRLHDGIESIGEYAFAGCIFTKFRVPRLITVIPESMLNGCESMFSVEIPHTVREISCSALSSCYSLRNVAFPPNAVISEAFPPNAVISDILFGFGSNDERTHLQLLFGSESEMITRELKHRFNRLPIHKLVYYQAYNQGVLHSLILAVNSRCRRTLRVKLDPTGNQQDCLGMTPLHILTCSSVHDLEVYRLIV